MIPEVGMYIVAIRNDGRQFEGIVDKMTDNAKGTLVVIKSRSKNLVSYPTDFDYSSVYLDNCKSVYVE